MKDLFYPVIYVANHLPKTAKLSTSARILLDVFIKYMEIESNLIYFCYGWMDVYLKYCRESLQIDYAEKTVRNAISELNHAGLLLKSRKDIYFINPLYFFKFHINRDHKTLIKNIENCTGINLMTDKMIEVNLFNKADQTTSEDSNI
jgi:hypothetical protein